MRTNVLNDLSNVVKKGTGLACSWSQVGRMSEGGAIEHPLSIRSASDGERWKPAGEKGSTRVWKHVAMIFAVLVMSMANVGMAWGYDFSASQITTSGTTQSNVTCMSTAAPSSGNSCTDGGGSYSNSVTVANITSGGINNYIEIKAASGYKLVSPVSVTGVVDNNSDKAIIVCYWEGDYDNTNGFVKYDNISWPNRKTACASTTKELSFTGTVRTIRIYRQVYVNASTKKLAASSGSGFTQLGGNTRLNITQISASATAAAPSTKRIYMKAGDWNNDSPKFFVHSWGSSDSDVQLTALGGCESDVFYADIPSGNTSLIFTRQNPSTSSIIWDGSDLWNRTDNISISTYDLFTFATWNGGPSSRSTFTGGTYSPTTYTITYAANGGGGSMSATSGICPDADQAITSNAFTAPTGCASFAHWTANVAVKVGGATVAAGSPIANGATIEDINSNITLTAVWKLTAPTIADNGDNTFSISGSIGGASYYYTTNGSTPTTSSSLYSSAVDFSAGETNITAKAIAHKTGYVDSDVASQACVYHEPPVCAISECGNATLTYVIKVGSSGSQATDGSDFITSATPSNSTALGASTSVGLSTITITDETLKAAAATNACFGSKPNMTGKIGIYNGASYSSSNYLQFTFTVKEGYTFTPCDIQFIVQPVSHEASFRWEVTDGTNVYGYGTGSAPVGSGNGATVLTGITSPSAMEAGTYYIRLYPFYNGSNTFRLGTDVILKGTTAAAACVAPTTVNITGTYHYFPGETISLTAAAEGGSGTPTTYQWYKGGTADGNIIEGATSATYSKASCTFADAGSYYCKVTRGGSCSTFSDNYDVKILHLYVKTGRNGTAYGDVDFVKVDATTARATISLGASWDYGFNIADGCGHYYGNTGSMNESNCTGWTMNVDGTDCLMRTTNGATYTFTVDYTTLTAPVVSITYPSANQAADKVIYFDNNDRNWSTLHYRIGRTNHTQATPMTKVPGTANLYKVTTAAYNNFSGWHIANNAGWTGDNNSIYRTYTNGDAYSITYATAHEGGAVTESAVTVTPTTSRGNGSDVGINDNCEFYNYSIASGMKRDRVTITAPVNGTITVNYTSEEGVASSFSATTVDMYQDLAHTVIITPTATPAEGYTLSGLTVNGAAHTSGNTYTVTANTTIAATFSPASYTVTLNTNGGTINAGNVTSYTYGTGATLPTNVTKDGFTFGGWYDNSGLTGSAVTTISTTATGNKEYWAKWTAAASLTALECNTLYKVEHMVPASITLTGDGQYGAGLSANTKFEVIGDPAEAGNAGGTPEMKNEAASFAEQSFTARMYLKGASNTTGSGTTFVPTSRAVKFIVSESGTLDIYAHRVDRLYLKKVGDSGTTQLGTSTSGSGSMVSHNVTAGTYYIYSVNNGTCIYGVRLNCCTTPAAPTVFANTAVTSTTATFSITDAADAASYDLYYASGSPSTPTAGTNATENVTTKTPTITGLTASTTYYAWVRSVCDADHKSAWVALSGSSFTTTSTPAELTAIEANVLYQAADMANITFTGSDQWFAGLSTNAKFKTYGDGSSTSAKGKTVSSTSITDDIDTKNFTSIAYIMTADNTSSTSDPTKGAIEFITPSSAGDLYLYFENTSSALTLKKKGTSTSLSLSGAKYKKVAVEANTHYFINGAGSNRGLYGIKFIADVTAPTFVSSVPANGATGVATSGTIVLTFSEALGSVDASKFTLTGATKGAVSIDGTDATKVNIAYSGAANEAIVTLATAAAAVSDLAGNALAAALSNISFTTAAAAPAGDCDELFAGRATSTSVFTPSAGSATFNLSSGNSFSAGGYSYSVKPNSSNAIVASPKAGGSFAAGDSLIVVIYNNESGAKTMGFRLGSGTYSTSVGSKKLHIFRQVLVASDISAGKVTFNRQSSDDRWVEIIIKHCGLLPSCTTPELPTLTAKTVCEGGDADAAWNAAITNSGSLVSGETVAYSWVKKGGSTPVSSVATYQPTDVTEAMAGTYVVTATVSADGKASKSASKEVMLTVTPATETPSITANKAKVYATDEVTLTATCGSTGVTWNWYLCANADGTGAGSSLGTSATYTIASAPAAGTYYYKAVATGDGTHSCGTAEYVYTLVVSAANSCDKEFWFAKEGDRPTGAAAATHITGCPSGSSSASYTASIDGTNYTLTGSTGQKTGNVTIVVPADNTGTLYVVVQGSSSRTITLSKGGTQKGQETPENSTWGVFTFDDLDAGTYTLVSSGNISWAMMALKLCPTAACTDDTPTATATNATVCAGGTITITATGYEIGATFQWQKQNASTSVWEDIDDATSATYTVATAAAEHAGNYHIVANKTCARTSNTVTIAVPSVPVFGAVPSSVTVMQTIALSITTVEASDAASYKWYKSANSSLEAGDPEIGSSKELMKAYAEEAIGTPSYYVFCVATNSCGADTTSAIAVNVTAYVDADCAIAGSSGEHNTFSKTSNISSGTYGSVTELHMNSNNKYLQYVAEDGYYFKTAKVNACVNDASSLPTAAYSYSTDGGANWTDAALPTAMTTAYADHVIDPLPANVNAFRVGRKLGDYGSGSGTLYIHEVCFEYSESCTSTTVTASPTSKTHTIGDSFTKPTFTVKHGETTFDPQPSLTYTSSNEDIATVDDDGTVNFQGMTGTVTITASFAGGTISATEYCASSGSYTITVSCSSERPKIVPGGTVNMSGCNPSVALNAKMQDGTSDFSPAGTYQWYRDGEAISGATSASYTARQAGIYTVERTYDGCTNVSSNNATITSERVEPEVERLVPFQYYHVDSIYHKTSIMRYRHLFTVKASEEYNSTGRNFKMELSKNGSTPEDKTTSNAFVVKKSEDNTVDTVLIDLNTLSGKFAEGDELIFTCKAVDCAHNVSEVYKDSITMHVIDKTPTMALILAGKDGGTLDEYEAKNLQEQTGSKSWSGEWPLYTEMKKQYIITPLNGYAPFNKLNYEQYDIIFLTDFPKKSKNATAINNLADLCDYRPLFTFKTHMSGLSKWATKGFTEDPEVPKQSRLRLNIVCYAHPMFEELQTPSVKNQMLRDADDNTQLVYTLLKEGGYEKYGDVKKGIQGFDFSASDNFVTIGLIHYDATAADSVPNNEHVTWKPGSADKTLVAAAERQYNPEARMVMFSLNAGAHSKLTETGQNVVLACLEYLLQDVMITPMADCAYTFDNDEGRGNGKWSVATNWLQEEVPGPYQSVRIIAPATVDCTDAKALEVRLVDNGKITIAKNGVLTVQSTIRRKDGSETLPTEEDDIVIETAADGQGALIFNNDRGDSRATVNLYSKGRKDGNNYQFQYIAMPMGRVPVHPYFEGSDIFTYAYTEAGGWERRGYYTDLYAFEGIGVTTRRATESSYTIKGALTSTEAQTLDMTYENPKAEDKGYNMFGNSWSAPIQISQLRVGNEDANIQKTVYIYVAGKDPDGGPTTSGDKTEVAGKWLAIPFDASGFEGWTGLKVIPAFQAFEIQTNAAATLSLDYDKMVRGGTTDRNAALRGPQRRSADHEGIELMVLHLNGGKVSNDLFLFEGEQFSEEFDNGWEATYKEDEEIPTQLYSPTVAGKMAVAALPTLEGTQVNFKTDEAGEYTFTFSGAEIGYYLNDIKEQESALIKEGNAYVFTLEDGDDANRFYISRTPLGAPAIVTGIDEVDAEAMKVRKIIHNDQLYIIRGGQLYDATGKVVK